MLESIILLSTIMAIVNATIPFGDTFIPVPLEVQPLGAATPTQQPAAATGGLDFAGITGLVTAIGAILGGIGFKVMKDSKREETRSNLLADTAQKQVYSLQETDKADYIFRAAVVDYITNPDETKKQKLIELSQDSKENYKSYYEDIKPKPLDYSKDPVVKKLSAVQKRTEPSSVVTTDD